MYGGRVLSTETQWWILHLVSPTLYMEARSARSSRTVNTTERGCAGQCMDGVCPVLTGVRDNVEEKRLLEQWAQAGLAAIPKVPSQPQ